MALIDAVAAAGTDDERRRLYEDPRLTVPDVVTSYTTYADARQVTVRRAGTARSAPPA
ncbi:hypothetical protein GCM10027074_27410 [Streptomyces deserti]